MTSDGVMHWRFFNHLGSEWQAMKAIVMLGECPSCLQRQVEGLLGHTPKRKVQLDPLIGKEAALLPIKNISA